MERHALPGEDLLRLPNCLPPLAGTVTRIRWLAALIGAFSLACSGDAAIPTSSSTPSEPQTAAPIDPAISTTATATAWRVEDFSKYGGSTATWSANPYGWRVEGPSWHHKEKIAIDTKELYNGHPTLRYDWPGPAGGGGWGGCNTDPAIVAAYKGPNGRELWIEVTHKFASNFSNKGPGCGSTAYKFLLMWRSIGDRYDIVNGVYNSWWSAGPQRPAYKVVSDGTGSWCSGYDSNCRWGYGPNQSRYLASLPGKQWDGLWHIYRVHIRISSSATTADGIYEVWVDGKQTVGRYGMTNAKADGTWSGRISEIYLGANSNSGTSTATKTWWGHLKIWSTNPGW